MAAAATGGVLLLVEDEDAIAVVQGGQAVGDENDRTVVPRGVDRLLDELLADVV